MSITVQDVINVMTRSHEPIENTVDSLKFGSPETVIKGIAVSFMPTQQTIARAIELGANLLITHEGLFFSHWDDNDLGENEVYSDKASFITDSGLAIYRNHDYVHRIQPDLITKGLVLALGWQSYIKENQPAVTILECPSMTVGDAVSQIKEKLGLNYVRVIGELSMTCKRVGVFVGYRGSGSSAIPVFEKEDLDLVIYGEGPEWETPEYVRDAMYQGKNKSLIVIGHAESEVPGMKALANILKSQFPSIPVHFVADSPIFRVV